MKALNSNKDAKILYNWIWGVPLKMHTTHTYAHIHILRKLYTRQSACFTLLSA